jgi:L-ascorbate metabolism protein UlaG (beta-lactamase superfamily)
METFAALELDYALFPGDGIFNMGLNEAAECAQLIGAKHNIIIHLKPGESVRKKAEKWDAPNKLIVEPGQEIDLLR